MIAINHCKIYTNTYRVGEDGDAGDGVESDDGDCVGYFLHQLLLGHKHNSKHTIATIINETTN